MQRTSLTWLTLACCVLITLGAMAWISWQAVRLEQAHHAAARQALLEENVRLALWRMESRVTPLIAVETSRPYFHYRAFYSPTRAYMQMMDRLNPADVMLASPLLDHRPAYVLLHFHVQPDGAIVSPQAPMGMDRQRAMRHADADPQQWDQRIEQLNQFKHLLDRDRLQTQLAAAIQQYDNATANAVVTVPSQTDVEQTYAAPPGSDRSQQPQAPPPPGAGQYELGGNIFRQFDAQQVQQQGQALQQSRSGWEHEQRQRNVRFNADNTLNLYDQVGKVTADGWEEHAHDAVREGVMIPLWLNDQLLLVRQVQINGRTHTQGVWLDWPALRDDLFAGIADLLPQATLAPVTNPATNDEHDRLLAAMPVRLIPGAALGVSSGLTHDHPLTVSTTSPGIISLFLVIAWLCLLLAILAVVLLMRGVIKLSERRASFVSAVTHEMRTPLTTFQMYTQMLADGMVREPDKQQHYLATLRREAQRLGHMVENVLSYARLERGRARDQWQTITFTQLIDHLQPRLTDRAQQADMQLCIDLPDELKQKTLHIKLTSVEQILFNLVDNACKYAADAEDRRIHLNIRADDRAMTLSVGDHGPGIDRHRLRSLFKPFNKSAHDAAHSAPGIGLGLALSRRLARDMQARLIHDPQADQGAWFVLRVPHYVDKNDV